MTDVLARKLLGFSVVGAIFIAPVIYISYRPVDGFYDIGHHPLGVDFVNIWSAPRIAAQHGITSVFNPEMYYAAVIDLFRPGIDLFVWVYPPVTLLLAKPFSLLPYWLGLTIWTICGFAAYASVILSRAGPIARTYQLVFVLLAPATLVTIVAGQNGFYTAALLLGAVVLLERRPWIAGVLFGSLVIKPHLAILVPFALIAIGAWRTMASATLTAVFLIGASIAAWGTDSWIQWLTNTVPYTYRELEQLQGFRANMMPSVFASVRVTGLSADAARIVQVILTLVAVGITPLAFQRTNEASLRALILSSGSLLVSPYAFHYDMTAMTGAILWIVMSRQMTGHLQTCLLGAAWVLPAAIYYLHILHVGVSPLIIGAVYVAAVTRALRGQRGESHSLQADPPRQQLATQPHS
jgi:Glycosyltransferase family 87